MGFGTRILKSFLDPPTTLNQNLMVLIWWYLESNGGEWKVLVHLAANLQRRAAEVRFPRR